MVVILVLASSLSSSSSSPPRHPKYEHRAMILEMIQVEPHESMTPAIPEVHISAIVIVVVAEAASDGGEHARPAPDVERERERVEHMEDIVVVVRVYGERVERNERQAER
jgi:hypothetical protein